MRHADLVVVQAFGTQAEADMAKSALESAGIDAMIQADTAGGMRPHLAWSGSGFRLLVREEDAPAASDVLKPSHETPASGWAVVESFRTQAEADTASDALFSAGIDSEIEGDIVGSLLGLRWFRVRVAEEDVAKARDTLKPPRKNQA